MKAERNLTSRAQSGNNKTVLILATGVLAITAAASAATLTSTSPTGTSRTLSFIKIATATLSGAVAVSSSTPTTSTSSTTSTATTTPTKTSLGINLGEPFYWNNNRSFMNLAAGDGWSIAGPGISGWIPIPVDRLDVTGTVMSLATGEYAIRILTVPNAARQGSSVRIRCTWNGDGSVKMASWIATSISASANELSFTWVPSGTQTAAVLITRTNPSNPVRQIDCREADASQTAIFHPDFVKSLSTYKTLRFMDWSNVNKNRKVTWATRTTPQSSVAFGQDGVAVENLIALANATPADAWLNISWNADDDYVRKYATYVRDKLAPGKKVYVEVSNEVWNTAFPVTIQAKNEAVAANLSSDPWQGMLFRYAEKSTQVMKIWTDVFAGQQSRLVRVVATQNANVWGAQQVLGYKDTAKYVDALATAPYFGHDLFSGTNATLTNLDTIFTRLGTSIDENINHAMRNKQVATTYGKRYIAYEAGQHVVNTANTALVRQIQRDPRMGQMYKRYLTTWDTNFADGITLYSDVTPVSRYGAWGLQEYIGQPISETPKLQAVQNFATTLK